MMMLASIIGPMIGGMKGMGGKDEKFGSTYSPQAQGGLNDLLAKIKGMGGAPDVTQNPNYQQGQDWLQSMFNDPQFFDKFEAPMQRQFEENTVPDLANRFASMGSGGSLGSTGFRNQLGREGSNLQTNIAAMRGQMQQNAIPQLQQYAQQPFNNIMQMYGLGTQPTNNQYQSAQPGFMGNVLGNFAGGASQGYGQQWGQNMAGNGQQQQQNAPYMWGGGMNKVAGQYPGTY